MRAILFSLCCLTALLPAQRLTQNLDGRWDVADGLDADALPAQYGHRGPVPGLANLARPVFEGVDLFDSREVLFNRVRQGRAPASVLTKGVGVPHQNRNYFWYRRTFKPEGRRQIAILKVNKAQFGTKVWLNGKAIGEHWGCFTAGFFDLTAAMRWDAENELVVRIGAHPAVLPPTVVSGTDFEKNRWTPGIYDDVSVILADNPVVETVQVAPRIGSSSALVQTVVHNYGAGKTVELRHTVYPWKGAEAAAGSAAQRVALAAGETKTVTMEVRIPNAHLWSPDDPFLYKVVSTTGGDAAVTRFGMREIRFDTATKRAWLNGKVFFLRGSNITFHRFLEDPDCGNLPWDEAWVRKLLVEIPREMHWNSFRFCIGPVPDRWLDIADEAGLLIQNEFFIWTGRDDWGSMHPDWDPKLLEQQYREWMRDNWNHPSVAVWDASNETINDALPVIIPKVRGLDLSNRAWESGYNLPSGPDDPVEDHPYLFSRTWGGHKPFRMTELEGMTGAKTSNAAHPTAHPVILNEYGWLWLNRDGSPTLLTKKVYDDLLGPNATADQRFDTDAYLLAGLTEFWRAHRNFAAVLHFVYLTSSYPGAYTSDHFRNVKTLELEPHFKEWVSEAFKPLGVYVNFWQPQLKPGVDRSYSVMLVNDEQHPVAGKLSLTFVSESGEETARAEREFNLPADGAHTLEISLKAPPAPGRYTLRAAAQETGKPSPTLSRRRVEVR